MGDPFSKTSIFLMKIVLVEGPEVGFGSWLLKSSVQLEPTEGALLACWEVPGKGSSLRNELASLFSTKLLSLFWASAWTAALKS